MDEKLCMVYVTASDKDEARKIAEKVVSMRLAACANIYDGVTSIYWWEEKVQDDQEATLIMKTRESLLPQLKDAVRGAHSYSCPCIVAIPIVFADKEYSDWIIKETGK